MHVSILISIELGKILLIFGQFLPSLVLSQLVDPLTKIRMLHQIVIQTYTWTWWRINRCVRACLMLWADRVCLMWGADRAWLSRLMHSHQVCLMGWDNRACFRVWVCLRGWDDQLMRRGYGGLSREGRCFFRSLLLSRFDNRVSRWPTPPHGTWCRIGIESRGFTARCVTT